MRSGKRLLGWLTLLLGPERSRRAARQRTPYCVNAVEMGPRNPAIILCLWISTTLTSKSSSNISEITGRNYVDDKVRGRITLISPQKFASMSASASWSRCSIERLHRCALRERDENRPLA